MKKGKTLTELATEIERQSNAARDFVVETPKLFMKTHEDRPVMEMRDTEFDIAPIRMNAHRQIGEHINVPAKYYDRMKKDAPSLLAINVNHWFRDNTKNRMVRFMDGDLRAFLSDRYHRIDNIHIASAVLPVLQEIDGLKVVSCEITDSRMYIKAVNERVRADVKVGDTVEAGVMITNSEVGQGALAVTPLVHRLVCLNGMVVNDAAYRRHHVGAQAAKHDNAYELYSDETLKADDNAIMLKARDLVRGSLEHAGFDKFVEQMRDATEGDKMKAPSKAVELAQSKFTLSEGEGQSILSHLIEGGDLSKYGLLNAVTRAAQDIESYDRSTELEQLGGKILTLDRSAWSELAEAA